MSFKLSIPVVLALLTSLSAVSATQCNATTLCPASAPCCSEYGFCGEGSFCLGGCNPVASNTPTSCTPEPICKDATYSFADTSRILSNSTYYDGNATKYDWVVEGGSVINSTDGMALILTEDNGGTRISSTKYVNYGTITAKLKTARWAGVVTAFITMSDIKDEIDWEFPGQNTDEGQSNFFWQGVITEPRVGETHNGISDTFNNFHEYTIDWQKDSLTWAIDGKTVRTVKRSDYTDNGLSRYPSTPSRVQLSIWPAGINSSGQGTIDWAGGLINWDDPDYKAAGHFYVIVDSVTVKCADSGSNPPDAVSYVYGQNVSAFTPEVTVSNESTVNSASGLRALAGATGMWTALTAGAAMALGALLV